MTKAAGVSGITVGGLNKIGPDIVSRFAWAIEYATGLGIGMADLPYEAIQWMEVMELTAVAVA